MQGVEEDNRCMLNDLSNLSSSRNGTGGERKLIIPVLHCSDYKLVYIHIFPMVAGECILYRGWV